MFFRLGALRPGNHINVTLADGITAVFRVTGVREYAKSDFPAETIYGGTGYAALHLITCAGAFDYASHHYASSTVVFATLTSYNPPRLAGAVSPAATGCRVRSPSRSGAAANAGAGRGAPPRPGP